MVGRQPEQHVTGAQMVQERLAVWLEGCPDWCIRLREQVVPELVADVDPRGAPSLCACKCHFLGDKSYRFRVENVPRPIDDALMGCGCAMFPNAPQHNILVVAQGRNLRSCQLVGNEKRFPAIGASVTLGTGTGEPAKDTFPMVLVLARLEGDDRVTLERFRPRFRYITFFETDCAVCGLERVGRLSRARDDTVGEEIRLRRKIWSFRFL